MRLIKIIFAITIIYVLFNWFSGAVMFAMDQRASFDNRVKIVMANER